MFSSSDCRESNEQTQSMHFAWGSHKEAPLVVPAAGTRRMVTEEMRCPAFSMWGLNGSDQEKDFLLSLSYHRGKVEWAGINEFSLAQLHGQYWAASIVMQRERRMVFSFRHTLPCTESLTLVRSYWNVKPRKKKFMANAFLKDRVCPNARQERTRSWCIRSAPPAAGPVGTDVYGLELMSSSVETAWGRKV